MIGEATERLARGAIITREIDSIAVYGREEGIAVHELIGLAGEDGSIGFCRVGRAGYCAWGCFDVLARGSQAHTAKRNLFLAGAFMSA